MILRTPNKSLTLSFNGSLIESTNSNGIKHQGIKVTPKCFINIVVYLCATFEACTSLHDVVYLSAFVPPV